MVSIGPYTQAYDMRHKWDFVDLRGDKGKRLQCQSSENTFLDALRDTEDFSIFYKIVQIAKLEKRLSDNFYMKHTLFVPSNASIADKITLEFIENLDIGSARSIVLFALCDRALDKRYIKSNPSIYFTTGNKGHRMYITTIDRKTELHDCTHVLHWNHKVDNGLIHVVDNILIPHNIPYPL